MDFQRVKAPFSRLFMQQALNKIHLIFVNIPLQERPEQEYIKLLETFIKVLEALNEKTMSHNRMAFSLYIQLAETLVSPSRKHQETLGLAAKYVREYFHVCSLAERPVLAITMLSVYEILFVQYGNLQNHIFDIFRSLEIMLSDINWSTENIYYKSSGPHRGINKIINLVTNFTNNDALKIFYGALSLSLKREFSKVSLTEVIRAVNTIKTSINLNEEILHSVRVALMLLNVIKKLQNMNLPLLSAEDSDALAKTIVENNIRDLEIILAVFGQSGTSLLSVAERCNAAELQVRLAPAATPTVTVMPCSIFKKPPVVGTKSRKRKQDASAEESTRPKPDEQERLQSDREREEPQRDRKRSSSSG